MTEWAPDWIDTSQASPARVYDYWLGGSHNFLADQDAARAMAAIEPRIGEIVRANRAFIGRAVRFLASAGVRQFLDIGSGIPTQGNVHEIAQRAAPGARVAYVDADLVAVAHSRALLAGDRACAAVQGDLREPGAIMADPAVRRLIDPAQPTGLLLAAVLHFVADADDPWRMVAELRDGLAPGSYLVISHGTHEHDPARAQAAQRLYNRKVSTAAHARARTDIMRFFDGFELAEPGLVQTPLWRPDPPEDVPADPARFANLAGVGRKP